MNGERSCTNPECSNRTDQVLCGTCYWQVLDERQRDLLHSREGVIHVLHEQGWTPRERPSE